jgi:hypothetical protein
MAIKNKAGWYEKRVRSWPHFIRILGDIETRLPDQRHHFFFRGQVDKNWKLESSLFRELAKKREDLQRCFQVEKDAKNEFASQAHLHLNPSVLPSSPNDWLEWWALMQHYGAPTRLLDWTTSPYVAAYFAVESAEKADGLIWALNDWALGDRMKELYKADWLEWKDSPRPTNNWREVSNSFGSARFFSEDAPSQIFFFQPKIRSQRVVAQQGWLSTSLNLFADYETTIGTSYQEHRNDPQNHKDHNAKTREYWKYWNSKIVIPKTLKREFLRRLQMMNITADSLFPGLDGLGRSVREFIQVEVMHDLPGSIHSLRSR